MNTTTEIDLDTQYRSLWVTWLRDVEFAQRWIDVDGIRTRIATAGDPSKPAVIMLHGTGAHWEAFAPILKTMSEHYYCIAFDMVGNGFSEKPDYDYEIPVYTKHVLGVMDTLKVERASIIGISLGAWVAARFGHDHPERTDKLILMSPAGLLASAEKMERIRRQRTTAVFTPDWESIKNIFRHLIADEENRLPDLIALRQAVYRRQDTRDTIERLLILQNAEVRNRNLLSEDEWRSIQAPTLVVASGKDHGEYTSTAWQILKLLPNGKALEMPHVAHWPSWEDPEGFLAAALPFLEGEA